MNFNEFGKKMELEEILSNLCGRLLELECDVTSLISKYYNSNKEVSDDFREIFDELQDLGSAINLYDFRLKMDLQRDLESKMKHTEKS